MVFEVDHFWAARA